MLRFRYLLINAYLILQIISVSLFLIGQIRRKRPYFAEARKLSFVCG